MVVGIEAEAQQKGKRHGEIREIYSRIPIELPTRAPVSDTCTIFVLRRRTTSDTVKSVGKQGREGHLPGTCGRPRERPLLIGLAWALAVRCKTSRGVFQRSYTMSASR